MDGESKNMQKFDKMCVSFGRFFARKDKILRTSCRVLAVSKAVRKLHLGSTYFGASAATRNPKNFDNKN